MVEEKLPAYGGQALIEGVMMRGKKYLVAAMRAPDHHIEMHIESLSGIYHSPLRNIPLLRGLIILLDSFGLGINLLTLSANIQSPKQEEKIEGFSFFISIFAALAISILFFFLLPAFIAQGLQKLISINAFVSNLIEGIIRLFFLIGYLFLIGQLGDIRRVFAYHGAEHKTINAYEDGCMLTPELVKKYSLEHPRCGTSFILTLVVFSIIIFTLLGDLSLGARILTRILFIPILASIAYEYIRWAAANINSPIVKFLISPNLLLQRMTTREPDENILEVSIAALNRLIDLENEATS